MVNSNKSLNKSSKNASETATKCFVAILLLNIIMACIAILIPDSSGTLLKILASFALFLFPSLIAIGNFRYIERYSTTIKAFSWISIIGSVLSVLFGLILIWDTGKVFAIDSVNDTLTSDSSTRSSNSLMETFDDDYLYDDDDYDYYDYDDDYDYNDYNYDYDSYNRSYSSSLYNSPTYTTTTGNYSISNFIPIIPKLYLVSSATMIAAFTIASCLKHKNRSVSIIGLKYAAVTCIAYCYIAVVAISFLPLSLSEMTLRLAILFVVLFYSGLFSWLALTIIAYSERRKATDGDTTKKLNNKPTIEQTKKDSETSPDSTSPESTPDLSSTTSIPEPVSETSTTPVSAPAQTTPEPTIEETASPTPVALEPDTTPTPTTIEVQETPTPVTTETQETTTTPDSTLAE